MAEIPYGSLRAATQPRILLGLVLIAAAMPVRFAVSAPGFDSLSLLDIMLGIVAVSLVLGCVTKPLDVGYPQLFALLCIPMAICGSSMLWTQDRGATFRATIVYAEGVIAYLFIVRELAGASPDRVITYIRRYSYLLIIPAALLLLRVPGFAPEEVSAPVGSDRYLSYYTRLSHPVLGPSNNLASVLAVFVPILLYWGHTRHDRRCTVAGYVALIAVVCTLSRGVIAALLTAAVLAGLGNLVRNRRIGTQVVGKAIAAVATVLAAIVTLYQLNPDTREFFASRFSLTNVVIRTEFAVEAVDKIADRPVLGYGAGAAPGGIQDLARVHNTYLQQALNFGLLLGVIVSLTLVGMALFFFSRWRTSPAARVIGFTLIAQLVVFAVESSFEGSVLRVLFYLSVGLLTGMVRACEVPQASTLQTYGDLGPTVACVEHPA
ncbi:O-antigen ligase family protein [Streptomyces justiciae]|uniref:O-antigen ligase family protein n=1 Tax=Streptomyces justiciae TaxID=2780140 RepID=UPI0018810734|nr:O-antigen ligase family protein [Streptomyces justiciae]MBE8474528.1 O-antigen ligase family protein [Streptomyces justiciae]MCW8378921.1 O-antigen ligase family protein [Streptomyces justiciae]